MLPLGFVYLNIVAPTILQNMMYFGNLNLIGERIKGYNAPTAILTEPAALALRNVQETIKLDNYSLVVFDAYRPVKAVDHFMEWSQNSSDIRMKPFFYPHLNKEDLFDLGYIARQSGHSRGSTVDLTIIEVSKTMIPNPTFMMRELSDGRQVPYFNDNAVDMFTSIDLMDLASWHDTELIENKKYLENRNYLKGKMEETGFVRYGQEWWHYKLADEPFPDIYFDFDVE